MKDTSSEMSQTLKRIEKILLVLVTLLIKIKHYYYDSLLLVKYLFFQFACTCLYSDDWADLCRMLVLVVEHLKQFFSGMNQNAFVEMTSCCAGEVTLPTTRWSLS